MRPTAIAELLANVIPTQDDCVDNPDQEGCTQELDEVVVHAAYIPPFVYIPPYVPDLPPIILNPPYIPPRLPAFVCANYGLSPQPAGTVGSGNGGRSPTKGTEGWSNPANIPGAGSGLTIGAGIDIGAGCPIHTPAGRAACTSRLTSLGATSAMVETLTPFYGLTGGALNTALSAAGYTVMPIPNSPGCYKTNLTLDNTTLQNMSNAAYEQSFNLFAAGFDTTTGEYFNNLPPGVQNALVDVAYQYYSLSNFPSPLKTAIQNLDWSGVYEALVAMAGGSGAGNGRYSLDANAILAALQNGEIPHTKGTKCNR